MRLSFIMKTLKTYVLALLTFLFFTLGLIFLPKIFGMCATSNYMCVQNFTDWLAVFGTSGAAASFVLSISKDKQNKKDILVNNFVNQITWIIQNIQELRDLGYKYWCLSSMPPPERDLLAKQIAGKEKDISRALTRLHNSFKQFKDQIYEVAMLFVGLKEVMTGGNFGSKTFVVNPEVCDVITDKTNSVISALDSLSDKFCKL